MQDFDKELERLLKETDTQGFTDSIDETGYYKTAFQSFRGQGSALRISTWLGIFLFGGFLLFCIWKFIQAETVQEQIFFGVWAILLNSAQIALKLWFNMQLNRRVVSQDLKRLQFAVAALAKDRH
jgi:hypothetical protein